MSIRKKTRSRKPASRPRGQAVRDERIPKQIVGYAAFGAALEILGTQLDVLDKNVLAILAKLEGAPPIDI
jgi:hypothetical protein